jgi:hypothetical protein
LLAARLGDDYEEKLMKVHNFITQKLWMLRCLQREALNKQNEDILGRGDIKPEQLFIPDDAFTAKLGGIFINDYRPASV